MDDGDTVVVSIVLVYTLLCRGDMAVLSTVYFVMKTWL